MLRKEIESLKQCQKVRVFKEIEAQMDSLEEENSKLKLMLKEIVDNQISYKSMEQSLKAKDADIVTLNKEVQNLKTAISIH